MIAVRSNERAAAGLGISVVRIKLYAFAVGAGIAGLGGVLLAFQQTNVQFTSFNVFGSHPLGAVRGHWRPRVDLRGGGGCRCRGPGALVSQVTNDLFPHLNNVAAWVRLS